MRAAAAERGVDVLEGGRVTSKRCGSGKTSGSRLAAENQSTTLSPFRIVCPRSSTSRVAVRRKCQTGEE